MPNVKGKADLNKPETLSYIYQHKNHESTSAVASMTSRLGPFRLPVKTMKREHEMGVMTLNFGLYW
jgi:hypothetical protein